jgi:hypothetical protein
MSVNEVEAAYSQTTIRPEREHNPSAARLFFHNVIWRPDTEKTDKNHQDKPYDCYLYINKCPDPWVL